MTASVSITKSVVNGSWLVVATVQPGADIPSDIFGYENNNGVLGGYVGVCTLDDYKRLQTFTGTPISTFGNKFLKYTEARHVVPLTSDVQATIDKMTADLKAFRLAFLAGSSSTQIVPL